MSAKNNKSTKNNDETTRIPRKNQMFYIFNIKVSNKINIGISTSDSDTTKMTLKCIFLLQVSLITYQYNSILPQSTMYE